MGRWSLRALASLAVLVLAFGFSGERPPRDPRFATPAATIRTFWRELERGAPERALECFMGVGLQRRGNRLLRLPPLVRLELRDMSVLPLGTGRVLVKYQVHYHVSGEARRGSFVTGDELLLVRGQWRILRPIMPVLKPVPPQRRESDPPPRPDGDDEPEWNGPAYARVAPSPGRAEAACKARRSAAPSVDPRVAAC